MSLFKKLLKGVGAAFEASAKQGKIQQVIETDDGNFRVAIVGESFYQDALTDLAGDDSGTRMETTAYLLPDDGNKYDSNAVSVHIGDHKVGHLSRNDALKFRARYRHLGRLYSVHTHAIICGGGDKSLGVWLDLPPL